MSRDLKHFFYCLIVLMIAIFQFSCKDYEDIERRITALESRFEQLNAELQILQQIVRALQENIYVINVKEVNNGYDVELSDGSILHIKHGKDGNDGSSPIIGVKQYDNIYYWTVTVDNTETWLTDSQGNKIAVTGNNGTDGITPLLQIDDEGYWTISYDNGNSYVYLLDSDGNRISSKGEPGKPGDSFFQSVTEDDRYVYFTLLNGHSIKIPKQSVLSIRFDIVDDVTVFPGETVSVNYTVIGGTDNTIVKALGQNGWSAKVVPHDSATGIIRITAPQKITDDEIIVLVYDGTSTTIMASINCVQGVFELMDDYIEAPVTGGNNEVTIRTNVNYHVVIPESASGWIQVLTSDTRTIRTDKVTFVFGKNSGVTRYTTVELQDESGYVLERIGISQPGERTDYAALCAFYNALGGNAWLHNDNWCSENSIETWYGVSVENGRVTAISLGANNLTGTIPDEIGDLDALRELNIYSNEIRNKIPSSMASLSQLQTFNCRYNLMDVSDIAQEITTHPFFESWKLHPQSNAEQSEQFTALMAFYEATDGDNWKNNANWGTDTDFSQWYGLSTSAGNVESIHLNDNNLNGYIPEALKEITTLKSLCLQDNNLAGAVPDIFASLPLLQTLYLQQNNLSGLIPVSLMDCPLLKTLDLRNNYLETTTFKVPNEKIIKFADLFYIFPQKNEDFRFFVDSETDGTGNIHPDGSYEFYQEAEKGQGVNLFIIGEGYDAEENTVGGTAEFWMKRAAEDAFKIAPMDKLKQYYNVILVYAHSDEKGISLGNSKINSKFGYIQEKPTQGSNAMIDKVLCADFIQKSTGMDLNNSNVIVVVNSTHNAIYGGISLHHYNPVTSFALIPTRPSAFTGLVFHEAIGHGIGRLGDEYTGQKAYDNSKDEAIAGNANLDIESAPEKVKWAAFIFDPRYAQEAIGVYEGGKNFKTGVYRATETSIMRNAADASLPFNAPSRARIYENTMKFAYPGWTFDYEEFVKFDLMLE